MCGILRVLGLNRSKIILITWLGISGPGFFRARFYTPGLQTRFLVEIDNSQSPVRKQNVLLRYFDKLQVAQKPVTYGDNLQTFMDHHTIDIGNLQPLQWLCLPELWQQYPRLYRMAIDIFTIPPSSAEPERTFLGARRTQSWDRLRLSASNLEKLGVYRKLAEEWTSRYDTPPHCTSWDGWRFIRYRSR
jgi:hypothetical protein